MKKVIKLQVVHGINGLLGVNDWFGNEILETNFQNIFILPNNNILAKYKYIASYELYNMNGKMISSTLIKEIDFPKISLLEKNNTVSYHKIDKNLIIIESMITINDFHVFRSAVNGKWGIAIYNEYYKSYEIIVKPMYDSIPFVGNKIFIVKADNKYGIVNMEDELIIPFISNRCFDSFPYLGIDDTKLYKKLCKIIKRDNKLTAKLIPW